MTSAFIQISKSFYCKYFGNYRMITKEHAVYAYKVQYILCTDFKTFEKLKIHIWKIKINYSLQTWTDMQMEKFT